MSPRSPRWTFRSAVSGLGALFFALAVCTSSLGAESLKVTIDLALAHDASIASTAQGAQASRLEADAAVRAVFPTLALGGGYQYNTTTSQISLPIGGQIETLALSQPNNFDLSAGLRWLPFTGFAQEAGIRQKRLQADLADNTVASARIEVALRAIAAFREAQRAGLEIETLSSASQRAQLQIDATQALERQGMATKVDVLSLIIARLEYDQKLIPAEAALADALERLTFLTGKEIEVPSPPEEEGPSLPPPPLDERGLPLVKALAIQKMILETNGKIARSKFFPSVELSGALHYGLPGVNPIQNQWMVYGIMGAFITWSFDWGSDALKADAVDHDIAKLANDETTEREQIELNYNSALRDCDAAREALHVSKASLDLARTKMGIVKTQYEQGMASTTDFNDANLELTQAELQYRSLLLSLLLKASQIDALSGEPLEQWSVTQ
jgi:outer membrane protein TolC